MEPMQYLAATAVKRQIGTTLAHSALPGAPVLPVRPTRRQRIVSLFARLRPAVRKERAAPVRTAGVC